MQPPSSDQDQSDDVTVPAKGGPPVAAPLPAPAPLPPIPASPPLPSIDERARRAAPTLPPAAPRSVAAPMAVAQEEGYEEAIPPRLPSLVFGSCVAVAVIVLLVGGGIGVQATTERLADAVDARTTLIAVLAGLAWLVGGAAVALAIAVLGRAAAGILIVARKLDERTPGR